MATAYATIYATKEHNIADTGSLNVGTSKEVHAPIGKYTTGWDYKELIRFPMSASDFNGITQITSAVLKIKTTDTVHCANDNGSTVRVRGLNGSFAATGGGTSDGSDSWRTDADPVWPVSSMGTTGTLGSRTGTWNNLTVYEIDVTDYVEKYAPASIKKRDGTPCDDATNYGMVLDTNGSTTDSVEFKSMRGSYTPRLFVTGTTAPTPNAPTGLSPSGTLTSIPTSADFSWNGDASNDENPLTSWDLQMSESSAYNLTTGALNNTEEASETDNTTGISGVNVSAPTFSFTSGLARGKTYYWQVRHENSEGTNGVWSSITSFYIANVPDAPTWVDPTVAKPYAHISNLDDDSVWTGSGGEAIAELTWQYNHPDGLAMDDFTLNWGGVNYTKTDFGFAADKTWADGESITIPAPAAQGRGSANSVNAYITATDINGNTSSASSTVAVVTQWAQAIVQENHGSGAGNLGFEYTVPTGGTASRVAFLFRKGDGTPGSWYTDIGAVTPSTHLDVLVRLGTNDSTNNPQLPDFTVSYVGTGNLTPDLWSVTGTGGSIVLDGNKRRFGKRSCKVTVGSAATYVFPTYGTSDPFLIVTPGQTYQFSVYVWSSTAITTDANLRFHNGSDVYITQGNWTHPGDSEWHRISAEITVPEGVTRIKPIIRLGTTYTGTEVWIDSAQFEEGELVSQWKPGGIGPAVSVDVGGIQVDASKGGVFRLLSSDEGNAILAGTEGLTFKEQSSGATSDVYISGGDLNINTDLVVTGSVQPSVAPTAPVRRVYTSSDTWTKPSRLSHIEVEVVGGGGGGGGAAATGASDASAGGAGGSGAWARKLLTAADLASASTATVTVGSGGSAGTTSTAGGDGGTSSFAATGITTITAGPGTGGTFGSAGAGATTNAGGSGGTASGGDYSPSGQEGSYGGRVSFSGVSSARPVQPSVGGSNPYGVGGINSGTNQAGQAARGFGSGGAGGVNNVSQSARTGGAGRQGVVIVTEYYY